MSDSPVAPVTKENITDKTKLDAVLAAIGYESEEDFLKQNFGSTASAYTFDELKEKNEKGESVSPYGDLYTKAFNKLNQRIAEYNEELEVETKPALSTPQVQTQPASARGTDFSDPKYAARAAFETTLNKYLEYKFNTASDEQRPDYTAIGTNRPLTTANLTKEEERAFFQEMLQDKTFARGQTEQGTGPGPTPTVAQSRSTGQGIA